VDKSLAPKVPKLEDAEREALLGIVQSAYEWNTLVKSSVTRFDFQVFTAPHGAGFDEDRMKLPRRRIRPTSIICGLSAGLLMTEAVGSGSPVKTRVMEKMDIEIVE